MKHLPSLLVGGLLAFSLPLQTHAAPATARPVPIQGNFGPKASWNSLSEIKITNFQGEYLGHNQDLTLDLTHGRIVEVLVVSDQFLGFGGKYVAVPPRALIPDFITKTYRINISTEAYKAAPKFDMDKTVESAQTDQVVAAYHYFGQVPNFLTTGEAPGRTTVNSGRTLDELGVVRKMNDLVEISVYNPKETLLGHVQAFVLDVPNGRILNVYVQTKAPNNMDSPANNVESFQQTEAVIPPQLFSYNAKRDGLRVDLSKIEYNQEPRVVFEDGAGGQVSTSKERAAVNPLTDGALVQGTGFRDVRTTAQIYQAIQDGKLDPNAKVEVGTLNGRVTLRGPVNNQAIKDNIGAIAVASVRLDNVDNQIVVTTQMQASN